MAKPVIRASEIGTYVYCRRAWWLKQVAGFEAADRATILEAGVAAHLRHGRAVQRGIWQRRLALGLFAIGGFLLVLAVLKLYLLP